MNLKKVTYFASLRALLAVMFLLASTQLNASSIINGLSVHSELGQESFIAGLLLTSPSTDAREILLSDADKQIQVRVLAKRLSARRFKRIWIEGMAINASPADLERQSQNMARFSNLLKVTLTEGDIFVISRTADNVDVIINGSNLGTIEDPSFFDLLLRTWIGSVPLSSTFRSDLLAGAQVDAGLLARFNAVAPSDERIVAVANALSESPQPENRNNSAPSSAIQPTVAPVIAQPVISQQPSAPVIAGNQTSVESTPDTTPEPEVTAEPEVPTDPEAEETVAEATPEPAVDSQEIEAVTEETENNAPEQIASASTQPPQPEEEKSVESILEEEEEEFTAESLLAQQLYIARVKRAVYTKLQYPSRSIDRAEEGTVRLSVTIGEDRKVREVVAVEAPKYARLTKAAIKAVEKAEPYPEFPDTMTSDEFNLTFPIVFRLVNPDE